MKTLLVCFLGELNDLLPARQRGRAIAVSFDGMQTYKHLIESLGVPHPEVASIRVDGLPAELSEIARPDCTLQVAPYEPGDARLRPPLTRFILDGHLGKLASYLRILGFDVIYAAGAVDEALAAISAAENRILLTRDRGLLKRNLIRYGYCLRDQNPRSQLLEIVRRYDLLLELQPFTRCPQCNGLLQPVEKEAVAPQLLSNTLACFDQFWQCADCRKAYWRGSHYQRIQNWMNALLTNP